MLLPIQHPLSVLGACHWQRLCILLLTCAACFSSPLSWALASDRQQPLEISADQAELNGGESFSTYSGNVIITKGSIKIQASNVTVTFNDVGIEALIATDGDHDGLAYMSQQLEPNAAGKSAVMEAWGRVIDFQINAEYLTLSGSAKLIQQGNKFSGHKILLDIPKGSVKAFGGEGKQVNMTFLPNAN